MKTWLTVAIKMENNKQMIKNKYKSCELILKNRGLNYCQRLFTFFDMSVEIWKKNAKTLFLIW